MNFHVSLSNTFVPFIAGKSQQEDISSRERTALNVKAPLR